MKDLNILSLDLELNQPSGNIIQVGACIFNLKGEILETYRAYIILKEKLSNFIIKLTGIKQEQVDSGISLLKAYENMVKLHKKYNCLINFAQWGCGDSECLREQLNLDKEKWIGGRRTIDVKTIFISYMWALGKSRQAGLARAMRKLGMNFEGRKHDALDDAINTAKIYCKLLTKFKI